MNLQDLLEKLLVSDPVNRISWEDFFNHNFFKGKIFGEVSKNDFNEVVKKYDKPLDDLSGIEVEECYDKDMNFYGEVIKGTKILHGRGIFVDKNSGVLLRGIFRNGIPHGKGEMIYGDGQIYEGEFKNGCKFGEGKEIFPNGNEYKGEYKNDMFDGVGELKYNNGNTYIGEFKNNKRNGKGEFYNKKLGQKYVCEWWNDLKHGPGTIFFDNGRKIEGFWKNGIRDGEFKLYKNKDVNEFKVEVYQNGVLVKK